MRLQVILLLLLSITIARAEPSPIVSRLMNEPMSMLDYGLWRTELELRQFFREVDRIFISSRYDWKSNRIHLDILLYQIPQSLQKMTPEKQCQEVIDSVQDFFGVDVKTGKPVAQTKQTLLGKSFTHNGFKGFDISSAEMFSHLDQITQLNISVNATSPTGSKQHSETRLYSCSRPLVSDQ